MKKWEKSKRIFFDFVLFFVNNFFMYLLLTSSFTNFEKTLIVIADSAVLSFIISGRRIFFIRRLEQNSSLDTLGNINNPILSQLSKRAPGTYNHSINVGQLSGGAGKSIGYTNDYLKVGAYYHDIGKLTNAKTFIENYPNSTPHDIPDDIDKKIIDHVHNGLKLAKKYNLPTEIREIIAEHHGTTKISSLKKSPLSYPGPKPRSKLTAIIMLADCVEARSRSFKKLDESLIEKIVDQEIEKRVSGSQLENSSLTSSDLKKIRASFISTLSHINHKRKYAK